MLPHKVTKHWTLCPVSLHSPAQRPLLVPPDPPGVLTQLYPYGCPTASGQGNLEFQLLESSGGCRRGEGLRGLSFGLGVGRLRSLLWVRSLADRLPPANWSPDARGAPEAAFAFLQGAGKGPIVSPGSE